mmetsp:Transcript_107531/g.342940  ORF Transcript_107531/g.342940 Transcript_107531/m.342940 type:complete len:236 (+) Transcript_107531:633-1340(+)
MRLTCHFSSSSPTRYSSVAPIRTVTCTMAPPVALSTRIRTVKMPKSLASKTSEKVTCGESGADGALEASRNSSSNCSEIKPCSGRTSLSFTSSNSVTMRKASGAPVQNSLASHEPGNANFIAHKLTLKTVCLNGKSKTSTNSPIFCSMNTTGFLLGLLPLLLAPPLEAAEGSAEDVEDDDGVGPSSDEVAHSQGNGKGSPKSRPRRLRAAPSSRDRAVAFDRGSSGGTSVVVARA